MHCQLSFPQHQKLKNGRSCSSHFQPPDEKEPNSLSCLQIELPFPGQASEPVFQGVCKVDRSPAVSCIRMQAATSVLPPRHFSSETICCSIEDKPVRLICDLEV
uniref:(northern house mosquito) hypothetical protein n=1 Tax=Culex pipiens TaxID=7175 RepID=A0A8D8H5D3_CULPI